MLTLTEYPAGHWIGMVEWTARDGQKKTVHTSGHPTKTHARENALAMARIEGWTEPHWWQWWRWKEARAA